MPPAFRIPVLIAALVGAAGSYYWSLLGPFDRSSVFFNNFLYRYRADWEDEQRRKEAEREETPRELAERLRDDAREHARGLDYVDAIARLDQAAERDPEGNHTPQIRRLRHEYELALLDQINEEKAEAEQAAHSPSDASPAPSSSASPPR